MKSKPFLLINLGISSIVSTHLCCNTPIYI
nr:MAG TPA: hypothetical protein [Crassvirales sp.]